MASGDVVLCRTPVLFTHLPKTPIGMINPDAYLPTKGRLVAGSTSEPVQTSITEAAAACRQYRAYIAATYNEGFADGFTSYLLNREDLDALLQQQTLDGIRIYIGHEDRGKGPLVRLFVVGCQQERDGAYHDVIAEGTAAQTGSKSTMMQAADGLATVARLTSGRPCPSECGGKSPLNS